MHPHSPRNCYETPLICAHISELPLCAFVHKVLYWQHSYSSTAPVTPNEHRSECCSPVIEGQGVQLCMRTMARRSRMHQTVVGLSRVE